MVFPKIDQGLYSVGLNKNYFKNINQENIDAIEGGFLPKPTNDYPNIEEILV